MIPVTQGVVGSGVEGQPMGDCLRACVASIFELPLDEVPHFAEDPRTWMRGMELWLAPFGLTIEHVGYYTQPSDKYPRRFHHGWWMASVLSENIPGATHAVVMDGMRTTVAHDPSPHPRRTPYQFVAENYFVALDPAGIARRSR